MRNTNTVQWKLPGSPTSCTPNTIYDPFAREMRVDAIPQVDRHENRQKEEVYIQTGQDALKQSSEPTVTPSSSSPGTHP